MNNFRKKERWLHSYKYLHNVIPLNDMQSLWILYEENVARWLINKNKVGWMRSWVWTRIFRTSTWIWHEQRSQQGNKKEFQSNPEVACIAFQR